MSSLITVLIPTYNVAPYINECIDSVLNQTFQDFDILIIDDASTDKTVEVLKEYNNPRIKIIQKEKNRGLIDSLNLGFSMCTSKYIARVDGDDINDLTRFEKQIYFLENNPKIDVCGSWIKKFGKKNNIVKFEKSHEEISCRMLLKCELSHPSVMIRKKSYEKFKFDIKMQHAEDYDFWTRTSYYCRMSNLQEVLVNYRIHDSQVCSIHRTEQLLNKKKIKLNLWKKLEYNQSLFSDDFVVKMIMSTEHYTVKDYKKIRKWAEQVLNNNKRLKLYTQKGLIKVIEEIFDQVLYDTYVRYRRHLTRMEKIRLLMHIPIKWKIEVLKMIFKN